MTRLVLIVALVALAVPAYAKPAIYVQSYGYYVAHKAQDKTCAVFKKKPNGSWTIVGIYKNLGEAAAIMKSASDCSK